MPVKRLAEVLAVCTLIGAMVGLEWVQPVLGQLIDKTQAPNRADEGINKSLDEQIGADRGDVMIRNSSLFIIARDPFRAIRRGRQIFQRKFTRVQGQGPGVGDGSGDINGILEIGAGLADSCGLCHSRPRGSAGFGGNVVTRPDSRSAPHLFGIGLKEMLADEITADVRAIRAQAIAEARSRGRRVTKQLISNRGISHDDHAENKGVKGIHYGSITADPDGSVDTSRIQGVDPDLRVRPFRFHGGTISIREFIVGALNAELGLQSLDPDLAIASAGGRVTTPSGMVLDGSKDLTEAPPSSGNNKIPTSLVDFLEFYLLNCFKPGTYEQTEFTKHGRQIFTRIGCATCHIPDLEIKRDRRVADVETFFNPEKGIFNGLFATATLLHDTIDDGSGFPPLKPPLLRPFVVKNIFTDFKRHDLGRSFHERNYDGTVRTEFLTTPLWGVGSIASFGHDGRSVNLKEVILRHGGEAQESAEIFAKLSARDQKALLDFLNSLVLFPPDDTASNLNPGNPNTAGFPQFGHGSISLTVLFNDPTDHE